MSERDQIFFDMAFVSILSFQFHPGNAHHHPDDETVMREIKNAAGVALIALNVRNELMKG